MSARHIYTASTAVPIVKDRRLDVEAEMVITALEAGRSATRDRRFAPRQPLRSRGRFQLYADGDQAPDRWLFTRDVDTRGLGFICREQLPLGFRGTVRLEDLPNGPITVQATVYRCRACAGGWFEGVLYFQQTQSAFAA